MKKKRTFNKVAGWQKIKAAIVGEIMDPQSVESRADLMLPAYAALNALETGRLDVDGYFRINEMNCVALCLAARLHAQGSAAVKAAMEVDLLIVRAASDAMNAIGERYNRTGRFGATGEQLQQVRATITTVDRLAESAPVGVLLKAMREAADMVDGAAKQRRKEAA